MNVDDKFQRIDEIAVRDVSNVFGSKDPYGNAKARTVTFDDVADWYSNSGYKTASWLELLDLRKWIPQLSAVDTQSSDDESDSSDNNSANDVVFIAPLHNCGGKQRFLLTVSDADAVRDICLSTGFFAVEPSLLVRAMKFYIAGSEEVESTKAYISYNDFLEFLKGLLPGISSGEDASLQEVLVGSLTTIFAIFADDDSSVDTDGSVDVVAYFPKLAVGLSVLCGGSKSAKLSLGFSLFDDDGDGELSVNQLCMFLSSYLRVLLSFSAEATENGWDSGRWIDDSMHDIVMDITEDNTKATISFRTFGKWYNEGGHQFLSWIELINLEKWIALLPCAVEESGSIPEIDTSSPEVSKRRVGRVSVSSPGGTLRTYTYIHNYPDEQHNEYDYYGDELADSESDDAAQRRGRSARVAPMSRPAVPECAGAASAATRAAAETVIDRDDGSEAFSMLMRSRTSDYSMRVTKTVASNVCRFTSRMGFLLLSPDKVGRVFLAASNKQSGLISKSSFDEAVNKIKAGFQLHADETSDFRVIMDSLFYAFERTGENDSIDATDLAVGFSVLCSGSVL